MSVGRYFIIKGMVFVDDINRFLVKHLSDCFRMVWICLDGPFDVILLFLFLFFEKMQKEGYQPFRKLNDNTVYIHTLSNHPPSIHAEKPAIIHWKKNIQHIM